jgi:hypothetical protein
MSRRFKRSIPSSTEWLKSAVAKDLVRQALDAPSERRSQTARILRLLIQAHGADVPLPIIMRCAAQYNACIHSLRNVGFRIVNRSESRNGALHSWYRLEIEMPEDLRPSPVSTARSQRETSPAENMQLFAAHPEAPKPAQPAMVWRDPEMGGGRG